MTRSAEIRQRSVRIRGLPADAQEGLLQQMLEKIASVKRVEFFGEKCEAVAELENAAVCEEISPNAPLLKYYSGNRKPENCSSDRNL